MYLVVFCIFIFIFIHFLYFSLCVTVLAGITVACDGCEWNGNVPAMDTFCGSTSVVGFLSYLLKFTKYYIKDGR